MAQWLRFNRELALRKYVATGMSGMALAAKAGLPRWTVIRVMTTEGVEPTLRVITCLAAALDMDPLDLLYTEERDGTPGPRNVPSYRREVGEAGTGWRGNHSLRREVQSISASMVGDVPDEER